MSIVPSVLEAVTLYREGAVCVRTASVDGAGREVRVGGLPLALDPASLRAQVRSGEATIQDVRGQLEVELAGELDVPQEQRALEAAREALDRLERRGQRLAAEVDELAGLRPAFLEPRRGEPPREAAVLPMMALADFADAELARRLELQRQLAAELEDARREVRLREARLAEASAARRTERARLEQVAVVTLAGPPAGPLVLAVEYRVAGARWVPAYQLRLDRALGGGSLQLRASVAQATGEDWQGVRLALSTASLQRRTDLPELKALKLGRVQGAPPRSGWRAPPPGLDALFEPYDGALGARPTPALAPPPPPPPAPAPRKARPPGAVMAGAPRPAPQAPPMAMPVMATLAAPAPKRELSRMRKAALEVPEPEEEAPAELADALASFDEAVGLEPGGPPAPEPEAGLGEALRDYARLAMPGPAQPGRGRLQPVGPWEGVLAAQASVKLEVVVSLVAQARSAAEAVERLPLPGGTQPLAPVQTFDYRYDCSAPADVPSTGRWVTLPVATCAVKLTPQYVVVPAVEPAAYRTLQVDNTSPLALLPGPVDVLAGDEFLLTSALPAVPPGARALHRLGLGVEEAIKVARRTSSREAPGGFLGGSTVLPHEVEIEIANRLGQSVPLEVRERVPVVAPEHEKDVKVEETSVSPPWEVVTEPLDGGQVVRGARRWRLTVGAGETVKLKAQYAIRLPSDSMLVGGNRRA